MLRILCISHCLPHPATSGGNQRTALLLRALAEFGATDLIQVCRHGPVSSALFEYCREKFHLLCAIEPLERGKFGPWRLFRPLHPTLVDRLAQVFGDQAITYRPDPRVREAVIEAMSRRHYDLIVGRLLYPTAMADVLQNSARVPVVIDLDDVDQLVARENIKASTPWFRRLVFSRQRPQIERATPPLLAAAAHLWVSASGDAHTLESARCSVLPNIPYTEAAEMTEPCPPHDDSQELLFVGLLAYTPNVEGVEHFLARCLPQVRRAVPGVTVRIVGAGLKPRIARRWARLPGVNVVGYAADLREEYRRCAFAIVPVLRGGGTKIKAIECFAFGRTCVVTPHGHRGLEALLRHGECLWRADDAAEFADGCVQLLNNPHLRGTLAESGRRLVERTYSFSHFRGIIGETLQGLGLIGS